MDEHELELEKEIAEFELAKKHVEALLLVAKELCRMRELLEVVATNTMPQEASWLPETILERQGGDDA